MISAKITVEIYGHITGEFAGDYHQFLVVKYPLDSKQWRTVEVLPCFGLFFIFCFRKEKKNSSVLPIIIDLGTLKAFLVLVHPGQ